MGSPVNADLIDDVSTVSISDDEVDVCGQPVFSRFVDAGIFLWKDCGNTEQWILNATSGGGDAITYTGTLTSDAQIGPVTPISFEGIDSYQLSNTDQQLDFLMKMSGSGIDGLEFSVQAGAACLDIGTPANEQVVVGAGNALLTPPFDIYTLDPC